MASQRMTITLPERLAKNVRQEARKSGKPVSRVIADALAKLEAEAERQRLIEGYKAARTENKKFAKDALPLFHEVLEAGEK